MRRNRCLLALYLVLLASAVPAGADVLGRKTMTRPYESAGWCHMPYREYLAELDPLEPLAFTAAGPTTIVIDVANVTNDGWSYSWIDNFTVVKLETLARDELWDFGGCLNGSYFDFTRLSNEELSSIAFQDRFNNGPHPGWTGEYAYWLPGSASLPRIPYDPSIVEGSLALGRPVDPATTTTFITLTDLVPGEQYGVSLWWHSSIPFSGADPPWMGVSVHDTPQLLNRSRWFDTIFPEPAQHPEGQFWDYFFIDVPEGSRNLVVDLDGLSADADLYVRHGNLPDFEHAACIPYLGGTDSEQCTFELPAPGRWWIGVVNYDLAPISYWVRASWDEPLDFYPLASPCRVLDTRDPPGLPLGSGWTDFVVVAGRCGVPWSAKAVSLNITAVDPTGSGHLSFWPANLSQPGTSVVNFPAGRNRANSAILGLATDGWGDLAVRPFVAGNGSVHLIVDVNGYFQ